jgi:hypothetical protein
MSDLQVHDILVLDDRLRATMPRAGQATQNSDTESSVTPRKRTTSLPSVTIPVAAF